MIINKDCYQCENCVKILSFDTSKPYEIPTCPTCGKKMTFWFNADTDTELAEKRKNMPKYDPTSDPNSPFYIPKVECPYCKSTDTKKITLGSKAVHTAVFGLFSISRNSKNYHCNACKSDF